MKYINIQKYQECQLVAALNIYYYFYGKHFCKPFGKVYENLVDLVRARYGGAISIEKAHKKMGLKIIKRTANPFYFIDNPRIKLPFTLTVNHPRYGNHEVAVVGYDKKSEALLVPNFKYETTYGGWIFLECLDKFIVKNYSEEYGSVNLFPPVRKGKLNFKQNTWTHFGRLNKN